MGLDNPLHLAFLVLLLLLVFGAKRVPEIGRSLGGGMRGFRESISGETAAVQSPMPLADTAGALRHSEQAAPVGSAVEPLQNQADVLTP